MDEIERLSLSETESVPRSNHFYMVSDFEVKLRCFLEKLTAKYSEAIKISFKREDGSAKRGDYSIYLTDTVRKSENVQEIAAKLQQVLGEIVESCYPDSFSKIIIKFNRSLVYSSIVRQVLTCKNEYGTSIIGQNTVASVIPHSSDTTSLNHLRTELITQHAALVLVANGFKVYLPNNFLFSNTCSMRNLILYSCTEDCNLSSDYEEKLQSAITSEWKVELRNFKLESDGKNLTNDDLIILNGREYLNEKAYTSLQHYSISIGHLYVKKGDLTDCFKKSMGIDHIIQKHANDNVDIVLHITADNKAYLVQQSGLLSEILTDSSSKQYYLIHQGTLNKNHDKVDKESYFKKKYESLQNSLVHKYGLDVKNDETWETCIENLTRTVVTFDFLCSRSSLPVKINFQNANSESSEKGGTFVQYNCARLSMLFRHFEEQVETGYYQSLPDLADIDFTQLKQDDEWHLFFNYVFPYPSFVRELLRKGGNNFSNIPTHTIPQMLVQLSRDLSIYYNKTRILVEPYPHLQKRMFARLYLLKSIYQVMKCALALLNLSAVDKM